MLKIRLDRFIANNVNISRKESVSAIRKGFVCVEGKVERSPSITISTEQSVTYKDKPVIYKKYVYIMLNKPEGVLSAATDKSRKTVIDLVPQDLRRPNLFPVGRLDKNTTGLLLITDDGDFAHNLISPKKEITKTYIVTLDGNINEETVSAFKEGIVLADGTKCRSAKLEIIEKNVARVTVTEGKYHQIKRMFGVVGLGVNNLHRESIGNLKLPNNLNKGQCLELDLADLTKRVSI